MRSNIKENLIGSQFTRASVVQIHLKGFRRYETTTAHDQFGATRPVNLQVLRNLAFHHFALAPTNRFHIDSDGIGDRAIVLAVTSNVRDFRARNLILARHAGDVGTGSANPLSFHYSSLVP